MMTASVIPIQVISGITVVQYKSTIPSQLAAGPGNTGILPRIPVSMQINPKYKANYP
jgi:hypothetical protein